MLDKLQGKIDMTDTMTPEQRHRCMAAVKGKDTKPELIVRKYLFSRGLRYRLHDKKLPGKPDMVLKKYRTVVFIDGCFWHGHEGCRFFKLPKSNEFFWQQKIKNNKARDVSNDYVLQTEGWRVIRVWECEIKNLKSRELVLDKLYREIISPEFTKITERNEPPAIAAEPEMPYGVR